MFFSSLDNSFRKVFGVSPHRQNNARLRYKFFISFTAKAGFCAEWRRRRKQVTQQSYILFKPFLHEHSFSKTAVLTVHMMYQVIFPNSGALCMPNIALRSIVGCWQLKIWIRDKVHCVSRLRLLSAGLCSLCLICSLHILPVWLCLSWPSSSGSLGVLLCSRAPFDVITQSSHGNACWSACLVLRLFDTSFSAVCGTFPLNFGCRPHISPINSLHQIIVLAVDTGSLSVWVRTKAERNRSWRDSNCILFGVWVSWTLESRFTAIFLSFWIF